MKPAPTSQRARKIGMAFLLRVMKFTGPKFIKILLVPVALYYFLSSPSARRFSMGYWRRLRRFAAASMSANAPRGPLGWLAFRHILAFSRSMVDRMYAWSAGTGDVHYQVEGLEALHRVLLDKRCGAVFLVSHLGNFDLSIARSEKTPDKRFTIVLDSSGSRTYNQFRDKIFESAQIRFLAPHALTPIEVTLLTERVADGEVVIIAADRITHATPKNSASVNFLGEQALFPAGPYILAHLLKVPVYSLFALQKGNTCIIKFDRFAQQVALPRQERQAAIKRYAQQFATRLERECLQYPFQWYNFFDFWAEKLNDKAPRTR